MLALSTLLFLLPALAAAANGHGGKSGVTMKHRMLRPDEEKRAPAVSGSPPAHEVEERGLEKRYGGARLTYYIVETGNAGSCGRFLHNNEYVVAMTDSMMNPGYCGKQVAITFGGKTAIATVEDTCPGCPYAALDLSPGLFSFFADHGAGEIYGSWEFTDGAAQQPAPQPTPDPPYTPPVISTTTREPETTTQAPPPPPPPTSTSTTPTTSSVAPTTSSAAPTTSSAPPTTSSAPATSSSVVAPETLSLQPSQTALTGGVSAGGAASFEINNILDLGSLAAGFGEVVCNGNERCGGQ